MTDYLKEGKPQNRNMVKTVKNLIIQGLTRKRRETGRVLWMKEPHDEGLASHIGPESCGGGSNAAAEALTGVRAGQVLSREILVYFRVPTRWVTRKATSGVSLLRDIPGPCAVGDLGTYGNTLGGNREILCPPLGEGPGAVLGSRRT